MSDFYAAESAQRWFAIQNMTCALFCKSSSSRFVKKLTVGLTSVLLLGVCLPAVALDNNALSIPVGEAELTPAIRLDYVGDSNGFLAPENEKEVTGVIVAPEVMFLADRRLLSFTLDYSGSYALFSEDELDYDDHRLAAEVKATVSSRQRLSAMLEILKGHVRPNTGPTLNLGATTEELLTFMDTILSARYVFGAAAARGNVVLGLSFKNDEFLNTVFSGDTDLTEGRDHTILSPYARFAYRLSSDARVFTELRFREIDFDNDFRDRSDIVTSLGIAFSETGKTGGEARIGVTSAKYDDKNREDTTLLSADINLYYEPSNISRFVLRYSRDLNNVDSLSAGQVTSNAIDDDVSLTWDYNWSGFVSTRALLAAEIRDRDCSATTQSHATTSGGLEIGLRPRRWLEFGAGIQLNQRRDDNCTEFRNLDYERQKVSVFARATL